MKYIKLYESINNNKLIKESINWKMVEDIKDMSLEYIDEGFVLYIDIYNGFNQSGYKNVCDIKYSHDINEIKYFDNIFSSVIKLTYNVYIGYGIKKSDGSNPIYTFELIRRLRQAYPNEDT